MLDSKEAMPLRESSSSQSSGLTSHVSQMSLYYAVMKNWLRTVQDVLAVKQEEHRATEELLAA
jgi:hypothetical protein